MTSVLIGSLAGLGSGVGLAMILARIPWWWVPQLEERVAPYVGGRSPSSGLLLSSGASKPWQVLERLIAPIAGDVVRALERVTGGAQSLHIRLDRLGTSQTVAEFRLQQVACGVVGAASGLALGALTSWGRSDGALRVLALMALGAVSGAIVRDLALSRALRAREEAMLAEFPTIAELLALAVAAGEGAAGALERVVRTCRGELSHELARALADVRAGAPLVEALEALGDRTALAPLARFVDGIAVAIERGTPLADVLRAQARDVRDLSRRRLLEIGGQREIAMMAPVVFLILPVTVLFAVFPGLAMLNLDL